MLPVWKENGARKPNVLPPPWLANKPLPLLQRSRPLPRSHPAPRSPRLPKKWSGVQREEPVAVAPAVPKSRNLQDNAITPSAAPLTKSPPSTPVLPTQLQPPTAQTAVTTMLTAPLLKHLPNNNPPQNNAETSADQSADNRARETNLHLHQSSTGAVDTLMQIVRLRARIEVEDMKGLGVVRVGVERRRRVRGGMSWLDIGGEWIVWVVILSEVLLWMAIGGQYNEDEVERLLTETRLREGE